MTTIAILTGVLVAAVGAGYTATQPVLGDGLAFLSHGHTFESFNGETGRVDAVAAGLQLATGKEEIQTVRLADGRLAVVNKTTGSVVLVDSATLTSDTPPVSRPDSVGKIEPVATRSDGYLVDRERNTVELIAIPGRPAPEPVRIADGIAAAVPCADSVWVLTTGGKILEVVAGQARQPISVGARLVGITVADSHPVAVADDGTAYAVDGEHPTAMGKLGVSGGHLVLGSWRGAGRYVTAVDRTGQVGVLDPGTGHATTWQLHSPVSRPEYGEPVTLGTWVYVPDYAGPYLWRIDVTTPDAGTKPLEVPGQPGHFDLVVAGGKVWANSQYDRRVLIVEANGHDSRGDKGPRPEVRDDEGQSGPPAGGGPEPGSQPATPPTGAEAEGAPTEPSGPMVTIPSFARHTPHEEACAELERLKLSCRAVAGGDEAGLGTGEVLGTEPKAGTQVPEQSRVIVRYVGPLRTPSVVGVWYESACRQIRAAKLTCVANALADPAPSPGQLGLVVSQSPDPTESIPKGATVTITYRDKVPLPDLTSQMYGEACDRITKVYRMTCVAEPGAPYPSGSRAGQVYQQDPPAATVAAMSSATAKTTVKVRYYRGESTMDKLIGDNVSSACTRIQTLGLQCAQPPIEGTCAWGTGHAVNEVYAQQYPTGTQLPVGTTVTLTYYGDKCPLPALSGDIDQACAKVANLGFQCNPVAVLHPSYRTVISQDQPAGTYPLGSAITLRYSAWQPVEYWVQPWGTQWQANQIVVGNPGNGLAVRLGLGYPAGTAIPGGRGINQFLCTSGDCRGYPEGMFYSRLQTGMPAVPPGFVNQGQALVLLDCSTPGSRPVWRAWPAGSPRYYRVGVGPIPTQFQQPNGDTEILGCVW
jgi:beta-lactam-binding protein with PASTA domain